MQCIEWGEGWHEFILGLVELLDVRGVIVITSGQLVALIKQVYKHGHGWSIILELCGWLQVECLGLGEAVSTVFLEDFWSHERVVTLLTGNLMKLLLILLLCGWCILSDGFGVVEWRNDKMYATIQHSVDNDILESRWCDVLGYFLGSSLGWRWEPVSEATIYTIRRFRSSSETYKNIDWTHLHSSLRHPG